MSTSERDLVFSRLRIPPRDSDETQSHSDMVRGLVPSMVRCKGCAILCMAKGFSSFHGRYKCRNLSPLGELRVFHHWMGLCHSDEQVRCKGRAIMFMAKGFSSSHVRYKCRNLSSLWVRVFHHWMGLCHSDMVRGLGSFHGRM